MINTIRLFLLMLLLAACGRQTAEIEPVTSNADWEVVVSEVGGVEMVQVPPGCFQMGHAEGRRDEQPVHEVCFERPFWIDRFEVTNGQFGSQGAFEGENRPRENLTWFEARDHCAARGGRLPTEAEWEYAARGPDSLIYPWGDELDTDRLVFDGNFNFQTADVGSHADGVSWVGAYDLGGNVWEWVSSAYRPYPFNPEDGREDPNAAGVRRVYRGGMGSYIDYGLSAAKRFRGDPNKRDWFIGFRCMREDL